MTYQDVLHFWFEETTPAQWFEKDPTFDETIRQRFGECHRQATQGELVDWRVSVRGRLARLSCLINFHVIYIVMTHVHLPMTVWHWF